MSNLNPKSAKDALGASQAISARRRTVKNKPRLGSSPRQAVAPTTKKAAISKLLHRKQGATLAALQDATGWKPHSLRAALTGLRKSGVEIRRGSNTKGETVYRAAGS